MSADQVSFPHTYEIAILGNDMVLAARPAHVVQLVHALYECGYELVVPLSWGEELLAQHALDALGATDEESGPWILCVCPKVRRRLGQSGKGLTSHLLTGVAPPVATARFLRALQPEAAIRITYIGACDGAKDAAIDTRVLPTDLLRHLDKLGVAIAEQPTVFESIVPPDRRRHWSVPGGAPSLDALREVAGAWAYRELAGSDIVEELAESIIARECSLLDLALHEGCHCAGASAGREALTAMEPPRAGLPVVNGDSVVSLELGTESVKRTAPIDRAETAVSPGSPDPSLPALPEPRRYAVTPSSVVQLMAGTGDGPAPNAEESVPARPAVAASRERPPLNEIWSVARSAAHTRERRRRTPRHFTAFAALLAETTSEGGAGEPHPVPSPAPHEPELLTELRTVSMPIVSGSIAGPVVVAHEAMPHSASPHTTREEAPDAPASPGEFFPPVEAALAAPPLSVPATDAADAAGDQIPIADEDITWGPPELFTISRPVSKQMRSSREPRRVPGPGPSRTTRLWLRLLFVALIAASTVLVFVVLRQISG